jgi:flagellar hook assembly protein FlgD
VIPGYIILGKKVATLVHGKQKPGFHRVVWNAKSDQGMSVSSGVYFVQMDAKNFTKTKKIVLMK